jgi:hypothetical protein
MRLDLSLTAIRTAIYMIWAWHFNFHDIDVEGSEVAIDATEVSPVPDPETGKYQGTGVSGELLFLFIALGC